MSEPVFLRGFLMAMLRRGAMILWGSGLVLSWLTPGARVLAAPPAAAADAGGAGAKAAPAPPASAPANKVAPAHPAKPVNAAQPARPATKTPPHGGGKGKTDGDAYVPPRGQERSWFLPAYNHNDKRSDIGVPLVSFLLPGFGQWLNEDYTSGAVYSGAAIAGYAYAINVTSSDHLAHQHEVMRQRARDHDVNEQNALAQKDIAERKATLGTLVAQGAGGLSLYHSFRTSVATRRPAGEYTFLVIDETPMDLLAAPLHFAYLARPTTYIPLAIGAAIAAYQINRKPDKDTVRSHFSSADALFMSSFSYNAGTHEEAVFRGWVMPVAREYGANDTWSNVIQSVLFAAAHLGSNSTPIPQLLLGYDLGYVAQKNHWALAEGVFIHAWWDVIAFYAQYQFDWKYAKQARIDTPKPVLWAPPLEWHF